MVTTPSDLDADQRLDRQYDLLDWISRKELDHGKSFANILEAALEHGLDVEDIMALRMRGELGVHVIADADPWLWYRATTDRQANLPRVESMPHDEAAKQRVDLMSSSYTERLDFLARACQSEYGPLHEFIKSAPEGVTTEEIYEFSEKSGTTVLFEMFLWLSRYSAYPIPYAYYYKEKGRWHFSELDGRSLESQKSYCDQLRKAIKDEVFGELAEENQDVPLLESPLENQDGLNLKSPEDIVAYFMKTLEDLWKNKSNMIVVSAFSTESVSRFIELLQTTFGADNVAVFRDTLANLDTVLVSKKVIVYDMDYHKYGAELNQLRPCLTTDRPPDTLNIFITDPAISFRGRAPDLNDFCTKHFNMK